MMELLHRIVSAEMLPGFRLHLRYEDGFEGVAFLDGLVRHGGALAAIAVAPKSFTVTQGGRAVAWRDTDGDEMDLCADALRQMAEAARVAAE